MNGQYLCNQAIAVQYAYKKDSQGERHGSQAERMLAQSGKDRPAALKPHTNFANIPAAAAPPAMPAAPMMGAPPAPFPTAAGVPPPGPTPFGFVGGAMPRGPPPGMMGMPGMP